MTQSHCCSQFQAQERSLQCGCGVVVDSGELFGQHYHILR